MRFDTRQIEYLLEAGSSVYDSNGDRIGSLGRIYLDDQTDEATWATVNTGLLGLAESYVPLIGSHLVGDDIHVAHSKEQVREAPRVSDDDHLSVEDELRLYQHYGIAAEAATTAPVVTDDIVGVDPDMPAVAPGRDVVEPVSDHVADAKGEGYTYADHGEGAHDVDRGHQEGYTYADHGEGTHDVDHGHQEGYTYADHGEGTHDVDHGHQGGYTSNDPAVGDNVPVSEQEPGASPRGHELL